MDSLDECNGKAEAEVLHDGRVGPLLFAGHDFRKVLEDAGCFRGKHTVGGGDKWVEGFAAGGTDVLVASALLGLVTLEDGGSIAGATGETVEVGDPDIDDGIGATFKESTDGDVTAVVSGRCGGRVGGWGVSGAGTK
ncbi:MAG: hypothetical protein ACRCT2_17425 [Plesiomonas shigelloides]